MVLAAIGRERYYIRHHVNSGNDYSTRINKKLIFPNKKMILKRRHQ